ncbi:MAG: asparagine synthetase B family protein [Planctomycetota bacterium]|nr:MAG: asparagine synthetase B family protein [Planctomycetota bacterium]
MQHHAYVERVINLICPDGNTLLSQSYDEALDAVASGDPSRIRQIDGQFAILAQKGKIIRMARSIGRPMRYFLAKLVDGPCLIVAERIDEISAKLKEMGLLNQFHPSYTRMVPAHHLLELTLLGCPDPNPTYTRYFSPQRNKLSTDLNEIGRAYIGTVETELAKWLDTIDRKEPLGVLFSGGVDSGAVLLTLYSLLLKRGESPQRLKAFTLSVEGRGDDAAQARQFLDELDLGFLLEEVTVPASAVSLEDAVRVIEDYKPLDVQSAAMTWALCSEIRKRYPEWTYLCDGDGGDENLKDYPIEENKELTIRSVLNNLMLYQEGWGVNAVKHSLTFSGGQSRGHVRSFAPARVAGFKGLSPFALPNVIEVAEGIPFIELTDWDVPKLYALKGEIVRRGVEAITGLTMPIFDKRRFQHGAMERAEFDSKFPATEGKYRAAFTQHFVP